MIWLILRLKIHDLWETCIFKFTSPNKLKEFGKGFYTCEKQWEYNDALNVKGHKYNFEIQIDACDVVSIDYKCTNVHWLVGCIVIHYSYEMNLLSAMNSRMHCDALLIRDESTK